MLYSLYSPGFVLIDYHFWGVLQNYLEDRRLTSIEEAEDEFILYFAAESKELYKCRILKLIERWNELESKGDSVND